MQNLSMFLVGLVMAAGANVSPYPFAEPQMKRLSDKPVLAPRADKFDDAGAYNPAAVRDGSQILLLYRAQNKAGTSVVGVARSADGLQFTQDDKPLFVPETDYEKEGGCEDPRVQRIGGQYYLTYTGWDKKDAQLCMASSLDLVHWKRLGVVLPAYKGSWNKGWTKSGAIVPVKINDKWWMYYLGTADGADQMGVASSDDLVHWTDATDTPVLPKRADKFDSRVVEPGPAPIVTDDGILLIYNGADDKLVYRTGWVLFDKKDPTKVVARSDEPIFSPELDWELKGQVPNVVFVEGMIQDGKKLRLYYGAADTNTGVAEIDLK
jgi:predicted GH43/DUF377 family glycosyl hydrolase